MERNGPPFCLLEWGGRVGGEDVQEVLVGVVEHDFVVLPRMYGAKLDGDIERWDFWIARGRPWMEFEVMVERDGFFARFWYEGDAYLDLEFTPSIKASEKGACERRR